jgi:hypothetical protein
MEMLPPGVDFEWFNAENRPARHQMQVRATFCPNAPDRAARGPIRIWRFWTYVWRVTPRPVKGRR